MQDLWWLLLATALTMGSGASAQPCLDPPDRDVALALDRWHKPGRADRLGALNRLNLLSNRAAPAVPELIPGLRDGDPVIRARTAGLLGMIGRGAAAANASLLSAVKDPEAKVREAAIIALSRTRPHPAAAIPVLPEAIRAAPSADIAQAPLMTLTRLGRPALSPLVSLLRESRGERQAVIAGLIPQLGENAGIAIPALIEALGTATAEYRDGMSQTLGSLCQADLEPLIRALRDGDPGIRAGAARTLETINSLAGPAVPALISALEREGPPSPQDLSRISGTEPWSADDSQPPAGPWTALGAIGRPAVTALMAQLDQPDRERRIRAIRTLGYLQRGGNAATPRLIGLLGRPELRLEVIHTLRRIRPPARAALPMLTLLLKNRDPEIRTAAAWAIGSIGRAVLQRSGGRTMLPPATVGCLAAVLRDPDERARRAAVSALGVIGPCASAAIPDLIDFLQRSPLKLRIAALDSLRRLDKLPDEAQAAIVKCLLDPDRQIRIAAAGAVDIQNVLSAGMVEALLAAMADRDSGVRTAAAKRLAQGRGQMNFWANDGEVVGGNVASPLIVANPRAFAATRTAVSDPDRGVRAAAVHLLTQFKDHAAESVPLLAARIADPSRAVRINAASALRELGPAADQAMQALERAISGQAGTRPIDLYGCQGLAQTAIAIRPESKARVLDLLVSRVCEEDSSTFEPSQYTLWNMGLDACGPVVKALTKGPNSLAAKRRLAEILFRGLTSAGQDPLVLNPRLAGLQLAEPALRELGDDEDESSADRALRLLELLAPRGPSEARRILDEVARRGVKPWLVDFGWLAATEPEVEILLDALGSPREDLRAVAALAIAQVARSTGNGANTPIRTKLLDALIPRMADPSPEVRGAAIQAVAILAPGQESRYARVLPGLLTALRDPITRSSNLDFFWAQQNGLGLDANDGTENSAGKLQVAAIIALSNLGEVAADAVPDLIRAMGQDDPLVRSFALQAIGAIGPKAAAAVPPLISMLESGSSSRGRRQEPESAAGIYSPQQFQVRAAMVLGQIGLRARAAIPALVRALRSRHSEIASSAIGALGEIGKECSEVIPVLEKLMTGDMNPNLAEQAAGNLAGIGEAAFPALQGALHHNDPDVRMMAAQSLGNLNARGISAIPRWSKSRTIRTPMWSTP
jgi:HEAT repeat protein